MITTQTLGYLNFSRALENYIWIVEKKNNAQTACHSSQDRLQCSNNWKQTFSVEARTSDFSITGIAK